MDAARGSSRRVIPAATILVALLLVGTVLSLFATIKGADVPTSGIAPAPVAFAAEPEILPDGKGDLRMVKSGGASTSKDDKKQTLGQAPKETHTERQFLRRESILLGPGEYQCETTVQYLIDDVDFAMAELQGDVLLIGEGRRRQRLLLVPFEFRVGLSSVTQAFVNVPFGWSNDEYSFAGEDELSNAGGIGDVSAGLTRVLIEGNESFPDVLGNLSFSAPTGPSSFALALSTPGSSLGDGYWSVTAGLTFIHTYDPVVLFYGFGYRHRFTNTFNNGVTVNPGKQIFYRLGTGFAVSPRVTFSASFLGSYITENVINGVRVRGDIQEPMYLRLAATISRDQKAKGHKSAQTIEPFVNFGLTEGAIDSIIGISWTR